MKVMYIEQRGFYPGKDFTFGAEYKVIADYRQRHSGQQIADNGFVVIDNQGCANMLLPSQVIVIEDGEKCYTFSYKN